MKSMVLHNGKYKIFFARQGQHHFAWELIQGRLLGGLSCIRKEYCSSLYTIDVDIFQDGKRFTGHANNIWVHVHHLHSTLTNLYLLGLLLQVDLIRSSSYLLTEFSYIFTSVKKEFLNFIIDGLLCLKNWTIYNSYLTVNIKFTT